MLCLAVAGVGAPQGSDTSKVDDSLGGVIDIVSPCGGDDDEDLAGVDHGGAAHGSSIFLE